MALQLRRGTDAQRLGLQLANGELVWTTDTNKLYVGDGTTLGGINVLKNVAGNGVAWNNTTQKLDFVQENLSLTTVNVPEGNGGGQYFTAKRAAAAVAAALNAGGPTGISFSYNSTSGNITATVTEAGLLPSTAGKSGYYLTNDGAGNFSWSTAPIGGLQIPSEAGNQGKYLTTDGQNLIWSDLSINTLRNGVYNVNLDSSGNFNLPSGDIKLAAGKDIKRDNGSGTYVSVLGGLQQVVGDTAPTLGGDLTLNLHNIIGTGNVNIIGTANFSGGLGGNLNLNSHNITGTGNINITGNATLQGSSTNQIYSGNQVNTNFYGANIDGSGTNIINVALNTSRGTYSAPLNVAAGDFLSALIFNYYYNGTFNSAAGIATKLASTANLTNSNPGSQLLLQTNNNNGGDNVAILDENGVFTAPTFQAGDGNATHPSIGFTTDGSQDTGFFHPQDGVICVTTNGQEKARFDNGGLRVNGFMKVAQVNGTLPSPPEAGMIVLDGGTFKGYNGSAWVAFN